MTPHGYFVMCENGFLRGVLIEEEGSKREKQAPTLVQLYDCARLRNSLCSCRGRHKIVRLVQKGTGVWVE